MIKVDDLIAWAKRIAIGRSTSYPNGWIDATALKKLAEQVERSEPLPCKQTVDAVPVVRCKDCIYAERARVNDKGFTICGASYMDITDNDFCSYGERKDGERKDDADYQASVLMQEYIERYEPTYNREDGSM